MADISLGRFAKNGVYRLRVTILKDGVAWAGIDSVSLILEKPDRETQATKPMTMENDAAGIWYYDTLTTDLDQAGYWTATAFVTDGLVTQKYPDEISFYVADQP